MQIGSLLWGFLTFLVMLVGFMPILKVFQWVNLPCAAIGLIIGIAALLRPGGANRGPAIVGFACSALAAAVAVVRFTLGPGGL